MPKLYLSADYESRINPQYKGISTKYMQIRKQRQQLDNHKNSIQKSLNYSQRNSSSLTETLNRKKKQLKWLKSIRERHLSDIRYKIEKAGHSNQKLQQLRKKSEEARMENKRNIQDAMNRSRNQKLRATEEIKNKLQEIKRLKHIKQQQKQILAQLRIKQKQQEKSESKSKINNFFRHKNKKLLNGYKEMIKLEESRAEQSQRLIQKIGDKAQKVDEKMKKKKLKLKSIQDEIMRLKAEAAEVTLTVEDSKSSCQEKSNRSSIDFSRLSKKSSRPHDVIKGSYTTEIKWQKN